jgi:hypothetical protein
MEARRRTLARSLGEEVGQDKHMSLPSHASPMKALILASHMLRTRGAAHLLHTYTPCISHTPTCSSTLSAGGQEADRGHVAWVRNWGRTGARCCRPTLRPAHIAKASACPGLPCAAGMLLLITTTYRVPIHWRPGMGPWACGSG